MEFKNIKGSIVALITPFKEDGSVNFDALEKLIERQIEGGTAAILSLGTTGEYPTMSHEEDDEVVACTIKAVAGRVPVIVGSGSNCTATQIKKSIDYEGCAKNQVEKYGLHPDLCRGTALKASEHCCHQGSFREHGLRHGSRTVLRAGFRHVLR